MARNFLIFFLILFSSSVIIFGGYNCAKKVPVNTDGTIRHPIPGDDPFTRPEGPGDDTDPEERLPDKETGKCHRKQYRELRKKYGASAFIDLNHRNLRDFLKGQEPNYELGCPRIFLNMEKIEGKSFYEGSFSIAYEDTGYSGQREVVLYPYDSGNAVADNKFNTWKGNWRTPDVDFAAIFENSFSAIILRIKEVEMEDVADGELAYKGYGEVWFKMFRIFKKKGDDCYTKGGYIAHAPVKPPSPTKRCWLLDVGPYSCLPKGIRTIKSFNLRGDRTCYKKLGEFGYLDIHEAFNLDSDEEHP